MAEEFDSYDAAQRLRQTAGRLTDRLRYPILPGDVPAIFDLVVSEIVEQLRLGSLGRLTFDGPRSFAEGGTIAVNPAELFQSIVRTLTFARRNLDGVPTLAPDKPGRQGDEAPVYTVIDVFDREAMLRVVLGARHGTAFDPREVSTMSDRDRAHLLRDVLTGHPWARMSRENDILQGLGMGLTLSLARSAHAAATNQPTIVNYTVNTQNSGLVLDAFPELQYTPRRFGATPSTPVSSNLTTGWWKFETILAGKPVKDSGRHQASSTNTSTITSSF
jgi:hypothetical protein